MIRILLPCLALAAPALAASVDLTGLKPALDAMSTDRIRRHVEVLASDEFEGRAPGTAGEEKTVAYLAAELQKAGLKPGNPNGSWFQEVPIAGLTSASTGSLAIGAQALPLLPVNDMVAVSRHFREQVSIKDSDVVFVGYGVQAPEFEWDDFKGVDVRGKTVIMLINDPPIPDPADPAKLDEKTFRGRAMTYYGRWTYKYEKATELGAAAVLIVHETIPAAYPWAVVVGSWGRENLDIRQRDGNVGRVPVEAWINLDAAKRIFAAAGQDYDAAKRAARERNFQPVALGAKAAFEVRNTLREINSRNVLGLIEGSDPVLKNEYIVLTAHWDHLGRDPKKTGDQIFNGAADNASGTAAMLEVARVLAASPHRPMRSILFNFVTAEEYGLLGSQFYAQNPLYPLNRTVANLNIDGANQYGPTSDVEIVGYGNTTIDEIGAAVAATEGRTIIPDANPQFGSYYRSDHFEFAKVGVPAFYPNAGKTFVGKPEGWGQQMVEKYIAEDYHKPSDEIKSDWDFSGMVQEGAYLMKVAWVIANGSEWPQWKPGTEFKALRDAMMKDAGQNRLVSP
jgi:Zn-dependent M28 family amino/carboxypeptidase